MRYLFLGLSGKGDRSQHFKDEQVIQEIDALLGSRFLKAREHTNKETGGPVLQWELSDIQEIKMQQAGLQSVYRDGDSALWQSGLDNQSVLSMRQVFGRVP